VIGNLLRHVVDSLPDRNNGPIARMIADVEKRSHQVPLHIRAANNVAQVSRWWATLGERK
jgi:hypothetical protein